MKGWYTGANSQALRYLRANGLRLSAVYLRADGLRLVAVFPSPLALRYRRAHRNAPVFELPNFAKALMLGVLLLFLSACSTATEPTAVAPKTQDASPTPDAARRVPEDLLTQNGVNYGCKVNSDCQVKNIGNCCGYYPACVNKDSPTFPDKVKADCAKDGRMSICGFPDISGCECLEGRCTHVTGPGAQPATTEQ